MLARLLLDRRRRTLVSLYERRRRVLRSIIEAQELPARLRGQAYRALLQLPRDSSPTRIRNRCPLTGRSRAILRRFGLSRIRFRSLANSGRLLGVKKASWLFFNGHHSFYCVYSPKCFSCTSCHNNPLGASGG